METRKCIKCQKVKQLSDFKLIRNKWRSHTCKECKNKIAQALQDKDKYRKYQREWKREYRKTHKKTKEERRAEYIKYRDSQLQYHIKYYQEHKNKLLEYGKKYRRTDIGRKKLRDSFHKYNAIKNGVYIEYVDRDVVFKRDKGICHICKKKVEKIGWHLEHIIPLSRGGTHCYDNVAVSHARCNVSKKNKTMSEYRDLLERKNNENNKSKRPYYKKESSSDS